MTNNKPNDVLLPCPFCGAGDVKIVTADGCHFAQCLKCEATGPTGFKRGDEDDADWNSRAQPADQQGEPVATLAKKYDDTLLPFVELMRKELHANADKGDRQGWLSMSADTCMLEIIYHFGKLQASVKRGDADGIAEYGADVANMCMMLLDICGVINLVQINAQPATAKVVLPERRPICCHEDAGFNECLDEVAKLNSGQS
ncbi:Lar family restriction alleviation protein [Pseudomonas cannabina]|uniref:Lar family restriction alleviation protein n=1 Tax=Pseudomonas syringae group TaxID=136849 RepID=UPI0006B8F8FE|nr:MULTISPECIES: Lar family restriction alleviation protein [Pseudomonas syringae group]KPB77921.1 Uncharacterized protein AC507_1630 [Pseudomonas syringae pv. maculicola]QQN20135.1 hypothetical protein JGS08_15985 [Pseudomonas cannabina pv. alisalensis]